MFSQKQKRMVRFVFQDIEPEDLEVGESWILLVSPVEVGESEEREARDMIDELLSETGMSDSFVPTVQRPPTSQVMTGNSGEVKLRRVEGKVGIGIERME